MKKAPKIRTKSDVDLYFKSLTKKVQKYDTNVYYIILQTLPAMSRVRAYFIRKAKEHNRSIDIILQEREVARQEEIRIRTDKMIHEKLERLKKKRQINELKWKITDINYKTRLFETEIKWRLQTIDKLYKTLRKGIFDDFLYISRLIECLNFKNKIYEIKKQTEKEFKINFDLSSASSETYNYNENVKDSFYHLYYRQWGYLYLSKRLGNVKNKSLREELSRLLSSVNEYEEGWHYELNDRLCEIGKEERIEDFKSYLITCNDEIIRYITEHKHSLTPTQLLNDVAILVFCNMLYATEEENDKYFITISRLVSDKIGRNIRMELYQILRKLNHEDYYKFTTPLSIIIEQEKNKNLDVILNPAEDGIIKVSWSDIKFYDGYALIWHPSHIGSTKHSPFRVDDSRIKYCFNNISTLFINRLEPIVVKCHKGRITEVIKLPDFLDSIGLLCQPSLDPHFKYLIGKMTVTLPGLTKEQIRKIVATKDQQYLEFLCRKQLPNYKAYYLLEIKINSNNAAMEEEGFLFVIKETTNSIYLLYENSLPARASILFKVKKENFNSAVKFIHEFFSSHTINKRELLSLHKVDASSHGISSYGHVKHTTIYEWKNNLSAKLH